MNFQYTAIDPSARNLPTTFNSAFYPWMPNEIKKVRRYYECCVLASGSYTAISTISALSLITLGVLIKVYLSSDAGDTIACIGAPTTGVATILLFALTVGASIRAFLNKDMCSLTNYNNLSHVAKSDILSNRVEAIIVEKERLRVDGTAAAKAKLDDEIKKIKKLIGLLGLYISTTNL